MVEIYGIRRMIAGLWFEDSVCADSWEDAEIMADRMGGEVTGRLVKEYPVDGDELTDIWQAYGRDDWQKGYDY